MRLIEADALEREGWSLYRNYKQDKNTMVYEAKSIVEIPTAQPEPQWIPAKMRPMDSEEREYWEDVIAWMPLPEPYAERRNDGKIH